MGHPFVSRHGEPPSIRSARAAAPRASARARGAFLRTGARARVRAARGEQRGDTLIEVMVSAMMLAIIVVATLNGIDLTSRAAALGRDRSQATALAEQDQERMRGLSIPALREILEKGEPPRKDKVEGQTYQILSQVEYVTSGTGTSACSSNAKLEASYYETKTTVTWANMGKNAPVVQTSVIAPPAGASLIVQAENNEGKGTPGVAAEVYGPLTEPALTVDATSADGCAIFSFNKGGEYRVNVNALGYVDQNWFANSKEDPKSLSTLNLTVGLTSKAPYKFDRAGAINPKLLTVPATLKNGLEQQLPARARNVVASNSGITLTFPYRTVLATNASVPQETLESGFRVFPFLTPYRIFAGSCMANKPELHGVAATETTVERGAAVSPTVQLPALIVRVLKGTKKSEAEREAKGEPLQYVGTNPSTEAPPKIILVDTDTTSGAGPEECDNVPYEPQTLPWEGEPEPGRWVVETPTKITDEYPKGSHNIVTTIEPRKETERGVLRFPGQPYGTYNVCLLNPEYAAHPTEQPKYIFKSNVVNANPGVSGGQDGTWVTLYEGYSHGPEKAEPPEELHQGEGNECP